MWFPCLQFLYHSWSWRPGQVELRNSQNLESELSKDPVVYTVAKILQSNIRSPTCDLTDDRGTDAEQLSVEVAPLLHHPVHGRVEAMVVARSEVDHSVVQPVALSTRGKL